MDHEIIVDRFEADGFRDFNRMLKELGVGPYLDEPPLILEDGRLLVILVSIDAAGFRRIVGRIMLFQDMSVEYGEILRNFDEHCEYVAAISQLPEVAEFIADCFGESISNEHPHGYSLESGLQRDELNEVPNPPTPMEERVTDPRMHLWEQKAWFYEATFGTQVLSRVDPAVVSDLKGRVEFDEVQDNLHIHFHGASGRKFWAILLGHEDLCLLYEASMDNLGKFDFRGTLIIQRLWDYFNQLPNIYAYLEEDD